MNDAYKKLQIPPILNYNVKYYFQYSNNLLCPHVWAPHLHDELEIYILLEGDVSFAVESSLYKLSPGSAVITRPNEMHNCIINSESVHKHLCFWFDTSTSFLFDSFLEHDFGTDNLLVPVGEVADELLTLYEELKGASDAHDEHKQFYLTLRMLDLLRGLISEHTPTQPIPQVLREILSDMDRNFREIHSLDYFTEKYYVSASTLNRLFRTHLHTTPRLHLETKKLANSRMLLKSGSTVLTACLESGFSDCSNYIRLFKRRFSVTPKQYRDGEIVTKNT